MWEATVIIFVGCAEQRNECSSIYIRSQTKVAGNCEDCDYFDYYGLDSCFSSSIIHLHHPLTKESVSVDNYDGQNYGGNGEISIVDNDGTVLERIQEVHEETESDSLSDEENN